MTSGRAVGAQLRSETGPRWKIGFALNGRSGGGTGGQRGKRSAIPAAGRDDAGYQSSVTVVMYCRGSVKRGHV
jgi:hypothetical protein